jgi:hypothetical protein
MVEAAQVGCGRPRDFVPCYPIEFPRRDQQILIASWRARAYGATGFVNLAGRCN